MVRQRERFMQELEGINSQLRRLGNLALSAAERAGRALSRHDTVGARIVVSGDRAIGEAQHDLVEDILRVLATQQPVAGDLRLLIATIEVAGELERIGDYAKQICNVVLRSADPSLHTLPPELVQLGQLGQTMLHDAIEAFIARDVQAAERVGSADDQADALYKQARAAIVARMQHDLTSVPAMVELLAVAYAAERLADRATNIAERVVFLVSGRVVELNP